MSNLAGPKGRHSGKNDMEQHQSLKEHAREVVDQQKAVGAEQIHGVAGAVHGAARELESQMPRAAGYVHDAAARLEGAASALRERSIEDLVTGFGAVARSQPLAVFGGAVLAGFAISRFLKSSGHDADQRGAE